MLLIYQHLGNIVPAGDDALDKAVNSFLTNPLAAATALGLGKVKRDAGDGDDTFRYKAAGVEVEFAYHNKSSPLEGGKLSLSLEEFVVARIFPWLGGFLHTRLGKVKLSINLSNVRDWRHGYFKAKVNYEINHHGYNEKGVLTIAREHDDTGKQTEMLLKLVHLNLPPAGLTRLIPTFLISLHSDLLTVWNGTIFAGPIELHFNGKLDLKNNNIRLNFNGKLDWKNKNIRLDLGSHGRPQGLEFNWDESSTDHIHCKALYTSDGVVDTVLSFNFQRKTKYPVFGMSMSRGNTNLLTFEAVSVVVPELVHYDLTYTSELVGNGKLKLGLKTTKELPDKHNLNVFKEKKIELQFLPDNNAGLVMRTTAEYIGHIHLRLTTVITYNDAPLFDNELVFDHIMGNARYADFKINMVSMGYPRTVQRNSWFTTCEVNGYFSFNFRNPGQFQLLFDSTYNGESSFAFNINTHKFPFGFELEINDQTQIIKKFWPRRYDRYLIFRQKLKVTQKFEIDTTQYATARSGFEFYFNVDDFKEYNISGKANGDLKNGLEGEATLQNIRKRHGHNKTEILNVECKYLAATKDFDIKVSLSEESRYRHYYQLDIHGKLDLTNFGLHFYRDQSKEFALEIKGKKIHSYLAYSQYEITYQFPASGFKGDKIRISIQLSRLRNFRIILQYIPAYIPQTRIVLNFEQAKAKYTGIEEKFDKFTLSAIYQDPSLSMGRHVYNLMKAEFRGSIEMASNNPFAIKLKFLVKHHDVMEFELNNIESPFRAEMYDSYLLPEIHAVAGLPRKDNFKILALKESDPRFDVMKTDGSADFYIVYDDSSKYELWQAEDKLLMIGYNDSTAEAGVFVLPGNQSLNAKVSWQHADAKHEFKINISGIETHNIKLYTDGVNTYNLEASGDNIWLGKYNITRDAFIKAGISQLKGRWSGESNIENAPWTSSVYTQVDFDFPYRVDCRNVCYRTPPPEYDYMPPPCRPCPPPPPPPGYYTPIALSKMPAEPRNWFLNVSKTASGRKFGFTFNNGKISLH